MRRLLSHFLSAQFVRFLAVGVTAAALHWLSRFAFDAVMSFGWAVVCAYAVGMGVAYASNAALVFPNSDRPHALKVRDFVLVNLAFLPLVWALSLLFRDLVATLGLPRLAPALGHGLAIAVPMSATFLFYKFIAFGENTVR